MDSSSSECPINGLPPEIMFIIFDLHDIDSLKSFSLTCHRLAGMYFNYCTTRFTLCIHASGWKGTHEITKHEAAVTLQQAARILKRTQHVYRKVFLNALFRRLNYNYTDALLKLFFEPRWLEQLVVLNLRIELKSPENAETISNALAKMHCLKELSTVFIPQFGKMHLHYLKMSMSSKYKLFNSSLEKLVIKHILPHVIDCPNMRSLNVDFELGKEAIMERRYIQHGTAKYWTVKQLEELTMNDGSLSTYEMDYDGDDYLLEFFQQMPQLKRLYFETFNATKRTLQIICETFVQLEELMLCVLNTNDPHTLRLLSNLPQLRNFGWTNCSLVNAMSFTSVVLPNLQKLSFGETNIEWQSLACVPSIEWFKIKYCPAPGNRQGPLFFNGFAEHLPQLRFLWLDVYYISNKVGCVEALLAELPKLRALEILALENVLHLHDLHKILPLLPQLRRLIICVGREKTFPNCNENAELLKLVPNVNRIEMNTTIFPYRNGFVYNFDC